MNKDGCRRLYPKYCPDCGALILLLGDFNIPTCEVCDEEFWDEDLIDEVDNVRKDSERL